MRGLFVTGTDTGVGKTQVAAAIARLMVNENIAVRPRKPIESGCTKTANGLIPEDALTLKTAALSDDSLDLICPYQLQPAISPERAAEQAGLQLSLSDLQQACVADVNADDFLLIEAAGGFYSPMAHQIRCSELAKRLNLPVLLVVADKLGCINHALLTAHAIEQAGLRLVAVVINQVLTDENSAMDNQADLENWLERRVIPIPRQHTTDMVWKNIAAHSAELLQLARSNLFEQT
ncbi:MAG: dethiobiotin synthase [Methylococcales bacterium]